MSVWYRVRDLDAGRAFYRDALGFEEIFADEDARWAQLQRGDMEIALWEARATRAASPPSTVPDLKAEVERLRGAGVEVGVIVELHGQVRIVDVFDPDGNRIQLTEEIVVIRPAGSQDLPFLRDMLAPRLLRPLGHRGRRAARALRRRLGPPGRRRARRDRRVPAGRRRVVPALRAGRARLRLRRRGDAGADDRDRPEPARPRASARAARDAARAARAAGYGEISLSVEPDNPAIHLYEHTASPRSASAPARG